jgi:hypothetical protein
MAEEQSCLTRVNLYISLEIFWKYLMLLTERRGSSNRLLVIMFLNPLLDINRVPELPEELAASSVDGCGAPASRKAFNKRSLRSKQLAAGSQTLTCAFRRSGIGGLDLLTTTRPGFDLLGLGRWWVGQSRILNPGQQQLCTFRFRLSDWWLGGWSSRDRLWLIQPQSRRSPNKAESDISSNKSKEQKIHYEQGAALTERISSWRAS